MNVKSNPSPGRGSAAGILALLDLMKALRAPLTGCPWDLEQSFSTIAPYTIEEAYEIADAIQREDMSDLKLELGDLLFQVVFHSQMADEAGHFNFSDVADGIVEKMRRRHPHVFGDAVARTYEDQTAEWETYKAAERSARGATGILDDVPVGLPGLARAIKLQKRAASVGFDWPDPRSVIEKIAEEAAELAQVVKADDRSEIEDEFGDLLFALANLARHLKIDPDHALRCTNQKFIRRFGYIETRLREQGRSLLDASLAEMESLWSEAKTVERTTITE